MDHSDIEGCSDNLEHQENKSDAHDVPGSAKNGRSRRGFDRTGGSISSNATHAKSVKQRHGVAETPKKSHRGSPGLDAQHQRQEQPHEEAPHSENELGGVKQDSPSRIVERSSEMPAKKKRPPIELNMECTPEFLCQTDSDLVDLRNLDDEELDAMAQQQQLEEELRTFNLDGVEALAYVFIAKLKSLEKAFKWFDTARTNKIALFNWDSGIHVLRIDVERLTGLSSNTIFYMMDANEDGSVSKKEFKGFFRAVDTSRFTSSPEGSLKERSALKKQKLLELQAAQFKALGAVQRPVRATQSSAFDGADVNTPALSLSQAQKVDDGMTSTAPGKNKSARRRKSSTRDGGSDLSHDAEHGAGVMAEKTNNSPSSESEYSGSENGSSSEEEHEDDNSDSQADQLHSCPLTEENGDVDEEEEEEFTESAYEQNFRKRVRSELSRLGFGGCLEYDVGSDSLERSIIEEVAEELGMWSHVPESFHLPLSARSSGHSKPAEKTNGALVVFNLKKFAEETREKLMGIESGAQLEFPKSLSEVHRRVVHMQAAALGLCTHSEGKGTERRVVAYNLGDFAEDLRKRLQGLAVGESIAFPEDLSEVQLRLIRNVARDLDYWVESPRQSNSPCSIEVFNFADFTHSVRSELAALNEGEHKHFEPTLTEQLRRIVHSVAAELGLDSLSSGEGSSRKVSVAKLQDFREEVSRMLRRLAPGQRREFPSEFTMLQRKVVRETAGEMALNYECHEDDEKCVIAVTRSDGTSGTPKANPRPKYSIDMLKDDKDDMADVKDKGDEGAVSYHRGEGLTEASVINKLFHAYATGRYKGEAIFLRFPDLREFAEDAKEAMPKKHQLFSRFRGDLENVFDDTLQLQIDMGTRTRKGLTLDWFQVFIQKAMRKIGIGCVGMLYAILADRS
jgi:hypothetical protein